MSPQEINDLRREVKQLLVSQDLDRYGSRPRLVAGLKRYCQKTVSLRSLSMALTGFRTGQHYVEILNDLKEMLHNGGFIHGINPKNN